MIVRELIAKARDKLQDTDSIYWHDSELIEFYNECKRYLAAERKEKPTTITIPLYDSVYDYETEGVLRYISIKDSNGTSRAIYPDNGEGDDILSAVIVEDYDRIRVNNPVTGVSLLVKHIAFPDEDNLNDIVRSGDEECFKYYIMSKAYEKDADMENFQKAQYFWGLFINSMKAVIKNSNTGYLHKTNTVKSYFY